MSEIFALLEMILRGVPVLIFRPLDFPFFWLLVGLVGLQYKRIAQVERSMYGSTKNSVLRHVLVAILFGAGAGIVASLIMAFLGVSLTGAGVIWLLPLALLLMAVSPRLMCFSYAGGLIAVSHLLFGWPLVYVPAIMALVAVLHVTESVLIFIRGSSCITPVTVRNGPAGGVRTGFLMQGFWPLPLLMLFVITLPPDAPRDALMAMPSWWPLIVPPPEITGQENAVFTLFPVAAVLGYSDLATRFLPQVKARRSSALLLLYSMILLALAVLASHRPETVWLAALWAPLGHELVVRLGSRGEFDQEAAMSHAPDGMTVLDILPGGGAAEAGLRTGDVILTVDGEPAADRDALAVILSAGRRRVPVSLRRGRRDLDFMVEIRPLEHGQEPVLGIIPLPDAGTDPQIELRHHGALASWVSRLRRRSGDWRPPDHGS